MRLVSAALLFAFAAGVASARPGSGPPSLPPAAMRSALPEKARTRQANELSDMKGQEPERRARELHRSARRAAADGYRASDVLAVYERDLDGNWFRRGEIVVAGANPAVMATAAGIGLIERRRTVLASVGIDLMTFAVPPGMDTRAALRTLKARHPEAAPGLNYLSAAD